jgi:multicomponent Na+:H+ antiporter subunit F
MSSVWFWASLALVPPLIGGVVAAGRGVLGRRLVGVELATAFTIFFLLSESFAFDQASSIDLALTLAFMTLPGTVLLALFLERWL